MILRVLQFLFESILNKTERDLDSIIPLGLPTFCISCEFDLMKSYRRKYIPALSINQGTEEENLATISPKFLMIQSAVWSTKSARSFKCKKLVSLGVVYILNLAQIFSSCFEHKTGAPANWCSSVATSILDNDTTMALKSVSVIHPKC